MQPPTRSQLKKLEALARQSAMQAYAPYSQFRVGASVLTAAGEIFTGCNVENASYGLSNCAERTAVFNAVALSRKTLRLKCIVIYTPTKTATTPCGACRQVIHEFGPDTRVISVCDTDSRIDILIGTLLPGAFGPADLA